MLDRMTRGLEDIDDPLETRPGGGVSVDIEDAGDDYVVSANLPGFSTAEIDVRLDGETLRLSASREETSDEDDDGRYIRRERRRSVSRSVRLPEPVEETDAEADYTDGVLRVTLPKRSADGGHSIDVA